MHLQSNPTHPDSQPATELVLEVLPSGELAWLRPEPRYWITDKGRAAIHDEEGHT